VRCLPPDWTGNRKSTEPKTEESSLYWGNGGVFRLDDQRDWIEDFFGIGSFPMTLRKFSGGKEALGPRRFGGSNS